MIGVSLHLQTFRAVCYRENKAAMAMVVIIIFFTRLSAFRFSTFRFLIRDDGQTGARHENADTTAECDRVLYCTQYIRMKEGQCSVGISLSRVRRRGGRHDNGRRTLSLNCGGKS